jgi:hypothetical protein
MGLTQEEVDAMPPEKQQAIGEEIAQRMEDKMKMAKAEEANERNNKPGAEAVEQLVASL